MIDQKPELIDPDQIANTAEAEVPYLALSVDAVAESISSRMRAAEAAWRAHMAAMEAEAVRRCELLTAQAELDAELIRLYARRESHAIIASAQAEVGVVSTEHPDEAIDAIGEAALTFVERLEKEYPQGFGVRF